MQAKVPDRYLTLQGKPNTKAWPKLFLNLSWLNDRRIIEIKGQPPRSQIHRQITQSGSDQGPNQGHHLVMNLPANGNKHGSSLLKARERSHHQKDGSKTAARNSDGASKA